MSPEEARRRVRSILRERRDAEVPLAEAALLVAAEEQPGLAIEPTLARLDEMGAMAARCARAAGSPPAAIEALGSYLFRDVGLRGNIEDYYDPRNSYLNEVVERRLDIPITLSIVYLEVARRSGAFEPLPVGVSYPGHFLVKWKLEGRPVVVDCFSSGRRLEVEAKPELLRAATAREVLSRLNRNLKAIHLRRRDFARAVAASERIMLCDPENVRERRERGLLYAQCGRLRDSLRDLVRYVRSLPPDAGERRGLRLQIDVLRRKIYERN